MSKKFIFPAEVLGNHIAALGKTGSGKTSTAKGIVETVVPKGARVCILDTIKSDWWGLTSSADGKKPGLPFKILGGPRGHVPLHSNAGKAIGELVGSGKLPLSIIDMADFEPGGLQRFFVDFSQSLWRSMRGVIYLVIEEAHELAPKERAGFGAENLSIHWAKKLATGSRTKGIRLIVCTQRVQALHNAVLGSCETVIAHRLTLDADQRPVIDWLKNSNKAMVGDVADTLASLPTGTGWLCSGEAKVFEKVAFPKIKTYDNGKTPDGEVADLELATAPVDQDELRAIIGDAVKEAVANDPKSLKAEIARLTKLVATPPAPVVAAKATPAAASPALTGKQIAEAEARGRAAGRTEGEQAATEALTKAFGRRDEQISGTLAKVAGIVTKNVADIGELLGRKVELPRLTYKSMPIAPVAQRIEHPVPDRATGSLNLSGRTTNGHAVPSSDAGPGEKMSAAERKFLTVLAQRQPAAITRDRIAVLAGYSVSSGHIDTTLSAMRTKGWAEGPGSAVQITAAGATALGSFEPLPSGEDLQRYWLGRLDKAGRAFLQVIVGHHPEPITRDAVAEAAGYNVSSGHVDTTLSYLRSVGVITGPGSAIKASEDLF